MALDKLALIMSLLNKDSGGNNSKPIDSQVNSESENPVQNKAIYDFVNSSVASNTAYFKGIFDELTELESIADATNNDYAFVISVDSNGNTVYNRYKYSDNKWIFEYALNNSSFTANQWNTINSGITYADIQRLEAEKVNKITGKGLSTEDFTTAEKKKLSTLENYNDSEVKSQTALNRSTLGYQRKNLLKNTAVSITKNGVTFTVNADGSVTINGTATANAELGLFKGTPSKEMYNKPLKLSGCPSGGSGTTYRVYLQNLTSGYTNLGRDDGNGADVTVGIDVTQIRYLIIIYAGYTAENLTFYPMLRYAEITNDTYEPYKPSVEERLAVLEEKFAALEGGGT